MAWISSSHHWLPGNAGIWKELGYSRGLSTALKTDIATSNCENGILIELSKLKDVQYDADRNIVTVRAGCIWKDVYQAIEPHGVIFNGGRDIGELLCGDGLSWLLPRYGFACDTVVNYEVVPASGDIINANKSDNTDLFIAPKGGACKFGIVSRFDLEAFETTEVWVGMRICNTSSTSTSIQSFVNYVNNVKEDLDTSYRIMWRSGQPSDASNGPGDPGRGKHSPTSKCSKSCSEHEVAILVLMRSTWKTDSHLAGVVRWSNSICPGQGALEEWLYLKYADKSQNPLRAYGEENISKMQAVALKYDPDRVFQEKYPGGFKIAQI
ncbi:hypothetical protein Landi51_04151 [Colletotrichum acutatum]